MANYYELLKVSQKASSAEIKSAYRQLARKLHPDVNGGAKGASIEFARAAKAYEVLGNPQRRAEYDKKLLKEQFNRTGASVFDSQNQYAKRWRQTAYDRRYNEIIDRMIADERRETLALQKVIFPLVALFVSTFFVAAFKPKIWASSEIVGKTVFLALFAVGSVHLYGRLRAAFERYTYDRQNIHDSIFTETEPVEKPFSRFSAIFFLIFGIFLSFGAGLFIGGQTDVFRVNQMQSFFQVGLKLEFVFCPPIFVLVVDTIHDLATRFGY